jgi:hypothetical protein
MLSAIGKLHRTSSPWAIAWGILVPLLAIPSAHASNGTAIREPLLPRQLVTFEIVLGRLQLSQETFRIGSAHEKIELDDGGQRLRSIAVSLLRGRPTMHFQDLGGQECWRIQCKPSNQVEIWFTPGSKAEYQSFHYLQPAEGPISIEVSFEDGRPAHRAEALSLWHLQLNDPHFFNAYVETVLLHIEPAWDLRRTGNEIRQLLAAHPHRSTSADATREALLHLDSQNAAERVASSLELKRLGLAAQLELLATLQEQSITCQKRCAVAQMVEEIQPSGNDTAMRVAIWLEGDRSLHHALAVTPQMR